MATARELGPAGWKRYRGPDPLAPSSPAQTQQLSRRLERVQFAAAQLKQLGARRVILFGSLARGEWWPTSDVDLAVLGLPVHVFWKAGTMVEQIVGDCPVDLIPLEDTQEPLRRAIERDGVEL